MRLIPAGLCGGFAKLHSDLITCSECYCTVHWPSEETKGGDVDAPPLRRRHHLKFLPENADFICPVQLNGGNDCASTRTGALFDCDNSRDEP